jgi:vacuolar-type H+-ATPase subunit H
MVSSKERKDEEVASTVFSLSLEKQQQEIRKAIVDAFDEAKVNTEKALKEAKKEIPRYREAINNNQEKTLELRII